jgi:Trypsin
VHSQYDELHNWNDIALMFLNNFVSNATCATLNYNSKITAVDSVMTAIGYGRVGEGQRTSLTLQEVDLQVDSSKTCAQTYYDINDRIMICNRGLPTGERIHVMVIPVDRYLFKEQQQLLH